MAMNNHSFDILCRVLGWRWKRPHDCKVTTSKFIQNNNQGNWKTLMSRISYLGHMNQSQGQRRRTAVSRIPSLRLGLLVAEYKRWIRKKSRVTPLLSNRPTWFDLPRLPHRLNLTELNPISSRVFHNSELWKHTMLSHAPDKPNRRIECTCIHNTILSFNNMTLTNSWRISGNHRVISLTRPLNIFSSSMRRAL